MAARKRRGKKNADTVGELVGGCGDGVPLNCPDPDEPDDWPWVMTIECKKTGARDRYEQRVDAKGVQLGRQWHEERNCWVVYFDVTRG